jgi:sec-independent protein translocase protein TatA
MNIMFGIFNLGGGEIILILALVLILFGAKKLPELAKGLGTGIKEFKKATRDVSDEFSHAADDSGRYTPPPPKRQELEAEVAPATPAQTTEPQKTAATTPAPVPHTPEQKS